MVAVGYSNAAEIWVHVAKKTGSGWDRVKGGERLED